MGHKGQMRQPPHNWILGVPTTDDIGNKIYLVLTEVFKKEICEGYEPKTVVKQA